MSSLIAVAVATGYGSYAYTGYVGSLLCVLGNCTSYAVQSSIVHMTTSMTLSEKNTKQKQSIRVSNQTPTKQAVQQPANTT